jgi:hypothetical protein
VTSADQYNQLFTMHGLIMMFLFIGPFAFGLANYLVPLHIGAPDMSFPRLNAFSYWLYLGGGPHDGRRVPDRRGPAATGWTLYAPLSQNTYSPASAPTSSCSASSSPASPDLHRRQRDHHRVHHAGPRHDDVPAAVFTWNMVVVSLSC